MRLHTWRPHAALLVLALLASSASGNMNAARIMMIETLSKSAAEKDVYSSLALPMRSAWKKHDGKSINQTLEALLHVPVDLTVHVKLVGFDGDGNGGVHVSDVEALRYLRALKLDLGTFVVEPEPQVLAVQPRLHFVVSRPHPTFLQRLQAVLHSAAAAFQQKAMAANSGGKASNPVGSVVLAHSVVDDVLATEVAAAGPGSPAFTLFIINPSPPPAIDYTYTYEEPPADPSLPVYSRQFMSCPGPLWVSTSRPYAWIDLSAGPLAYGPLRAGQGQVFVHSVPHVAHFKERAVATAMAPELAALAASAVQHLAWPPIQHNSVAAYQSVEVRVMHIHDTLQVPRSGVNAEAIKAALAPTLAGAIDVDVKESFISFAQCDVCVAAYTSAVRVRTKRADGNAVVASSGQLLDRLVLHAALREYGEVILAYAGVQGPSHNDLQSGRRRLLPVYVLNLSTKEEALLLDGHLQAAAFSDMVVAVVTQAKPASSGFSCHHQHVVLQPTDATRAVLGAILQSGFGVAHTSQRYHPASGVSWNHLWALGATPFGPLSALPHLSAPLVAAPLRNLALLEMDKNLQRLGRVLKGFAQLAPSGRWQEALPGKDARERVIARLNVAAFKAELAARALAEGRNADALKLAKALVHEAQGVEHVAARVEATLIHTLTCSGATPWTQLVWAPAGSVVAVLAAVWWRGRSSRARAESRYDRIY